MWKRNVLQSRKVRASAAVTGAAPSAPTPASANIRASAAAVAELADELDFLFDQINYEGEFTRYFKKRHLNVGEVC